MKKKILGIFLCMLMTVSIFPAFGILNDTESKMEDVSNHNRISFTDLNECGCPSQRFEQNYNSLFYQSPDHILKYLIYKFQIRSYLVYLPPSYDGATPMPLVITLHGCPNNVSNMTDRFKISDKAKEEGFIAVYPEGNQYIWRYYFEFKKFLTLTCWNNRFCCGEAFGYGIDDVGFIRALIGKLQKSYAIDSKRIFIAGHSNGAMMAHLLGAELSDLVAAIAPNAGTVGGKVNRTSDYILPPDPEYPVSVIIFHGMKDRAVPYKGGKLYGVSYPDVLSVNASAMFWVEHDNCDTTPEMYVSPSGNITRLIYTNGDAGTEVIVYLDKNGDHYWFGESVDPYKEMSTTDLMWEFFETHPKK